MRVIQLPAFDQFAQQRWFTYKMLAPYRKLWNSDPRMHFRWQIYLWK